MPVFSIYIHCILYMHEIKTLVADSSFSSMHKIIKFRRIDADMNESSGTPSPRLLSISIIYFVPCMHTANDIRHLTCICICMYTKIPVVFLTFASAFPGGVCGDTDIKIRSRVASHEPTLPVPGTSSRVQESQNTFFLLRIAMSTSRTYAIIGVTAFLAALSAFVLKKTAKSSNE